MKLKFDDLFDQNESSIIAKKDIRIGALVIPNGHTVDPNDPSLGLPINDWKDKLFSVDIDNSVVWIKQVLDASNS